MDTESDQLRNAQALERFISLYQALNKDNVASLRDVYSDNVTFSDPAHSLHSWQALEFYFNQLFENVISCEFEIHEFALNVDNAFLNWTMTFAHPKLEQGKTRTLDGCSKLIFSQGKIVSHRDYFDLGAMIYEGVPVLGGVVKYIKKRLG